MVAVLYAIEVAPLLGWIRPKRGAFTLASREQGMARRAGGLRQREDLDGCDLASHKERDNSHDRRPQAKDQAYLCLRP